MFVKLSCNKIMVNLQCLLQLQIFRMDPFRKGLRKLVHILGGKKILPLKATMTLLHSIDLCRIPDIKDPKDLNEKLMWMEFNTDTSLWARLADKHEVRKYVEEKNFKDILIPSFGVFNEFEEIDFSLLPDSFVVKSTNGCGQTVIITDGSRLNKNKLQKTINSWLQSRYGFTSGERHYTDIKPRIIIEELLPLRDGRLPVDYKFYCFNGSVDYCLIVSDRKILKEEYKLNLFGIPDWKEIENALLPVYKGNFSNLPNPEALGKMVDIASKLSEGHPFVRIDLYEIEGKIYFGEMTFTPAACRTPYISKEYLIKMGEKVKLNTI